VKRIYLKKTDYNIETSAVTILDSNEQKFIWNKY